MQKVQQSNKSYWRHPQSIFTVLQDYTQCYIEANYEIHIIPKNVGQYQNVLYLADQRQLCCYSIEKQFPLTKHGPQINLINAFNITNSKMLFLERTPIILNNNQVQVLDITQQNGNIDILTSIELSNAVSYFGKVNGTTDSFYVQFDRTIQIYTYIQRQKQLIMIQNVDLQDKIQMLDICKTKGDQYLLAYYTQTNSCLHVRVIDTDSKNDEENSDSNQKPNIMVVSKKLFTSKKNDGFDQIQQNTVTCICINYHIENFITVGTAYGDVYILYTQPKNNILDIIEQYNISSCEIVSLSFSQTHPDILLTASSDNQLNLIRCGFKPQILVYLTHDDHSMINQYVLLHELVSNEQNSTQLTNNEFGSQKNQIGYYGAQYSNFTITQTLHALFDDRNLLSLIQITDKDIITYTLKLSSLSILWLNNMSSQYIKRYLRDLDMKDDINKQLVQLKVKILEAMYRRDISGALKEVFNEIDNILEQQSDLILAEQCFGLFEPCMKFLTWAEQQDIKAGQEAQPNGNQNTISSKPKQQVQDKQENKVQEQNQKQAEDYETDKLSISSLQSLSAQTESVRPELNNISQQLKNPSQELKKIQNDFMSPKKAAKLAQLALFCEIPLTINRIQCLYPTLTDKSLYLQYRYVIRLKKLIQDNNQALDKRLYIQCLEYIKKNIYLKTDRLIQALLDYLLFVNNPGTSTQAFALELLQIRQINKSSLGNAQNNNIHSNIDSELLNFIASSLSPSIFSNVRRSSLVEMELFVHLIKTSMDVTMRNIENLDIKVLNQTYFRNQNEPEDGTYQIFRAQQMQDNVLISNSSVDHKAKIFQKQQKDHKNHENCLPTGKQHVSQQNSANMLSQNSSTLINRAALKNAFLLSDEVDTQIISNNISEPLVSEDPSNDVNFDSEALFNIQLTQNAQYDMSNIQNKPIPRHQMESGLLQFLKTIDVQKYLKFIAEFRAGYLTHDFPLEQLQIDEQVENFRVQIVDQATFGIFYTVLLVKKDFVKAAQFIESTRKICSAVIKTTEKPEFLSSELKIKASNLYISIYNNYEFYKQLAYLVNVSFWHKVLIYFEEQSLGGAQTADLVVQQLQIILECLQIPFLTANLLINTMSDRVAEEIKTELVSAQIIDKQDILAHNYVYIKFINYLSQIRDTFVRSNITTDEEQIDQCKNFLVKLHDVYQIVDNLNLDALAQELRQLITSLKGQ